MWLHFWNTVWMLFNDGIDANQWKFHIYVKESKLGFMNVCVYTYIQTFIKCNLNVWSLKCATTHHNITE